MKLSDKTDVAMPIKNMIGIIVTVAMGIFAYTEITSRLTSLETSRELFQADLLKKSEQLPTDQEQFMLIEDLYKTTEKLEITQEQNMTNKVNISFLNKFPNRIRKKIFKMIYHILRRASKKRIFIIKNLARSWMIVNLK